MELQPTFQHLHEAIDVIQFGQMLYELSTGLELKSMNLELNDYQLIAVPILDILIQIFPSNNSVAF